MEGLIFYQIKGEDIVSITRGVTKSRFLSDPSFKRTRENMTEFGGLAVVRKAFRIGFANIIKI